MWPYPNITREAFERKKDEVEQIIISLGGKPQNIELPYENKVTSFVGDQEVVHVSCRCAYEYNGEYFRVDEVCCFERAPGIVIEYGDYEDLIHNRMWDAEPFTAELPYDELVKEVKYSMGILPYPEE